MESVREEYILDREMVDPVSDLITQFCEEIGTDRSDTIRHRIYAEEGLLTWIEDGLTGSNVVLTAGRFLGSPYISIQAQGKPSDPYRKEGDSFVNSILTGLDLSPNYSYKDGYNQLYFRLRRKPMGPVLKLVLIILAAVVVSLAGIYLFPEGLREGLLTWCITPLYDTFFRVLSCIAGPMIFMSVTWGIYGIGDASTFSKIGKKLIGRFVFAVFFCSALTAVTYPLLGPPLSKQAALGSQLDDILDMILGIFPKTIIEPFSDGNTLQVVFLATVVGIALLYLGQSMAAVSKAIEQLNTLISFIMEAFSKLIPFVIFLVIVKLSWDEGLATFVSLWRLLVVYLPLAIMLVIGFLMIAAVRTTTGPVALLRKCLSSFLIGTMTASSAAAFDAGIRECEDGLGIDGSLARFGVPLGTVILKPTSAALNVTLVFYFAKEYGVDTSIGWIVLACFVSAILAIAIPPVAGGSAIIFTMLFSQMGIPESAVAIALAVDVFLDYILTGFEGLSVKMTLLDVAYKMGMVDKAKLRSSR